MDVELARQVSRALVWACSHNRPLALREFITMADTTLPSEMRQVALALDRSVAEPNAGAVALPAVHAPALLEAMCVAWSENYECSFSFTESHTGDLLCIVPSESPAELPCDGAQLSCSELSVAVGTPGVDPDIDMEVWAQINALAARTYVPSSDASRAGGAGAGITDTD